MMLAPDPDEADIVVVGAGSSGAVLTNRLCADGCRVLVLEAGVAPDPGQYPQAVRDGTSLRAVGGPGYVRAHPAHLRPGRPYDVVRGCGLGGSSAVNGGYLIRPRMADHQVWAAAGGQQWSYEAALARLIALEHDLDFGASDLHGDAGPMPVRRAFMEHPAAQALIGAATALGYRWDADKNAQGGDGVGAVPTNVVDGVRHNAAMVFIDPVRTQPNVEVRGECQVRRVLIEGGRAIGVEYLQAGAVRQVRAQVTVLCAGAIGSAHLLLASGIGPADQLRRLGVEVSVDSPQVGVGLSDHPQIVVDLHARQGLPTADEWMGGVLHAEGIEVLQSLLPGPALMSGDLNALGPYPMLVADMAAERAGTLRLASPDAAVPPALEFGYLRSAGQRARLRSAVRLVADLLARADGARMWRADLPPSRDLADEAALDAWVAEHLSTALHTCGTAAFGQGEEVTDGAGRVRGLDGLRVADLSILPTVPRRGPALAALLVGATIGDAIAGEA